MSRVIAPFLLWSHKYRKVGGGDFQRYRYDKERRHWKSGFYINSNVKTRVLTKFKKKTVYRKKKLSGFNEMRSKKNNIAIKSCSLPKFFYSKIILMTVNDAH